MASALNDFRSQVLGRAAESVRHLVACHLKLREAEVSQLDVTLRVKDDVLGLKITVDNSVAVETLKGKDDFCGVKSCSKFGKFLLFSQVEEQLPTVEEIDHKVKSFWRLESVVQLHDERVVDSLQDHTLN